MSEFKAKLFEKGFKEKVAEFRDSISALDPSEGISKFETRKILGTLNVISEKAERSIKEYVVLDNRGKVNELYGGTLSAFHSVYHVLPVSAMREAKLNERRFERRISGVVQVHTLTGSYSDLKSSFGIVGKKDEKEG